MRLEEGNSKCTCREVPVPGQHGEKPECMGNGSKAKDVARNSLRSRLLCLSMRTDKDTVSTQSILGLGMSINALLLVILMIPCGLD